MTQHSLTLTEDSAERKTIPMARGLLDYFPAALAEVAKVSEIGNAKHNPGQEIHWARGKSSDHADCIIRHLADRGVRDDSGVRHSAYVAWRALALLQEELELAGAAPGRASRFPTEVDENETIYLSGPMTGYPGHNVDAFAEASESLRGAGHYIVTPHELPDMQEAVEQYGQTTGWEDTDAEWKHFIDVDNKVQESCTAIAFLPGWEKSGGCGREGEYAPERGHGIYLVDGSELRPITSDYFRSQRTLDRATKETL